MPENTIFLADPYVRVSDVQRLVRPLRPLDKGHHRHTPVQQVMLSSRSVLAFAVSEIKRGSDHTAWFFRTAAENILGQYYEYWQSDNSGSQWKLIQLYLHLFEDKGRTEKPDEVFTLHCVPQEVADSHNSRMKRGPHVHVVRAGYPLGRAHFPLNLGHIYFTRSILAHFRTSGISE